MSRTAFLKRSLLPSVSWFIFTFILFSLPGSTLHTPGFLDRIQADKFVHATLFGIQLILLLIYIPSRAVRHILLLTAYAFFVEWFQLRFIPGRSADMRDISADLAGIIAGYFIYRKFFGQIAS